MKLIPLFILILFLVITIPVQAIEINPSVETIPWTCRYDIVKWALCNPAERGPQGPAGQMNMTPNLTMQAQVIYYLHNATDSGNASYHVMSRVYPTGSEQSATVTVTAPNVKYLLKEFITPVGDPGLEALVPGDRRWYTYVKVDSTAGGDTWLEYELSAVHTNGTETPIYNFPSQVIDSTTTALIIDMYTMPAAFPMNITDRFVMRYYANSTSASNRQVTMYYDDFIHVSKIESPIIPQGLQGPPGPAGTAINESYAYLPGRSGGQLLQGGIASTDALILNGSANNGEVFLNPMGSGSVSSGNTTGFQTILGRYAGQSNIADAQTAIGYRAGQSNTAIGQTALGYYAGYQNTGTSQAVLGQSAGHLNTGNSQTAFGYYAGRQNSGSYQSAFGNYAGYQNTGVGQIAFGYYAGRQNNGTYQTAIGYTAGYLNTANNLVALGYQAGTSNTMPNYFVIKQGNVNSNPLISGNFSSGVVTFNNYGAGTLNTDAGGNITSVSDPKLKTAITPYITDTTKISAIAPIRFKYNAASGLDPTNIYTGVSAENIRQSYPECVFAHDDVKYVEDIKKGVGGEPDIITAKEVKTGTQTLSIDDKCLIAILFNAAKDQQTKINSMEARITAIEKGTVKP